MNSVLAIILSSRSINQCKWKKRLSAASTGLDQVVLASSTVIDKKRKTLNFHKEKELKTYEKKAGLSL